MPIGTMMSDLVRSLFKKPATELYPYVKKPAPARLRGKLTWNPENCSGCQLCIKDCPSNAIDLVTVDKATKQFVMRYHVDHCIYCAQCVVSCRFGCLALSNEDWELAIGNKEPLGIFYGKEENIARVLEQLIKAGAEQPASLEE